MSFMKEPLKEMKLVFQSTANDNAKLSEENTIIKGECEDLRRRLKEDECGVTQYEEYSRRYNLEIKGVSGGSCLRDRQQKWRSPE